MGKNILTRLCAASLCLALFLTGCLQRSSDTSSDDNHGLIDFSGIFNKDGNNDKTEGNSGSNKPNSNKDNSNNSDNNSNDSFDESEISLPTFTPDGTQKEIEPVSNGKWKQERFYLSTGSIPWDEPGLKLVKDAGFNLVEFSGGGESDIRNQTEVCEKLGDLYCILNDEWGISFPIKHKNFYNRDNMLDFIESYSKFDCVLGYSVWDEPLPGTNNVNFKKAKTVKDILDKYDPNSLKLSTLMPSYGVYTWEETMYEWNTSEFVYYVDNFIDIYQPHILSLDYYPVLMGHLGESSNWWRDLGLFRDRSLKLNVPFWYYYQGQGIAQGAAPVKNDLIYYQMYVGLAYGAKELSTWLAIEECIWGSDFDKYTPEQKQRFYDAQARNKELMAVGNYLFDKTSVELCHTGTGDRYFRDFYTTKFSKNKVVAAAPDGLILSLFTDGKTDTEYLLVVNKNYKKPIKNTLTLKSVKNISKFNKETEKENIIGKSDTISIDILPGRGEIYILK